MRPPKLRSEFVASIHKINEILWKYWDPIGVYKDPMPDVFDEYLSYANEILILLYQYEIQKDRLEIYLMEIIREHIGLTAPDSFFVEKNQKTLDMIYSIWANFKKDNGL